MKLSIVMLLVGTLHLAANVHAQGQNLSIRESSISLADLLWKIQEQTEFVFAFSSEDVEEYTNLNIDLKGSLDVVLNQILDDTDLTFELKNGVYIISRKEQEVQQYQKRITVEGTITDADGLPIPGVNIVGVDLGIGGISNMDGFYSINFPNSEGLQLRYSSIGMKTVTLFVINQKVINVVMETEISDLDEVVITGFFERKKDTYTGVTKTVKGEELIEIGTKSIIESLNQIDPSFRILENNQFGSDPNKLPEISFRGASSFESALDDSDINLLKTDPNMPTFVP